MKHKKSPRRCVLVAAILLISLVMTACNTTNNRITLQFSYIDAVYDNMAYINSGGAGRRALVNLETGEDVIPFGEFHAISNVQDGRAIVNIWEEGSSIIDIATREAIVPFGRYNRIYRFHSDGRMIVGENVSGEVGTFLSDRLAVINLKTGEAIIPFGRYDIIRADEEMQVAVVRSAGPSLHSEWSVVDLITGEERIPIGRTGGTIPFLRDGLLLIEDGRTIPTYQVLDLTTGETLQILDGYRDVSLRGNGLLRVETLGEQMFCGGVHVPDEFCVAHVDLGIHGAVACGNFISFQGLINAHTGEMVLPIGQYRAIRDASDGMAVVEQFGASGLERALVELATGEIVIPFGVYDRIQLFPGGAVAMMQNTGGVRRWQFDTVASLKTTENT